MNTSDQKTKVNDGFDLIDYPCDYEFKAMCPSSGKVSVSDCLKELVLSLIDKKALLDVRSLSSRTGKFESVTLNIRVANRAQLEMIYHAIAESPMVVMTL